MVLLVREDPLSDVAGMEIVSRIGTRSESAEQAGLASLSLRTLMAGPGEPARQWCEDRGSALEAHIHPDYLEIGAAVRAEDLAGLVRQMANIVSAAPIASDLFDSQKQEAVRAAAASDDDQAAAYQSLRTLLDDGSAYGRAEAGVPLTLVPLQLEDARRFLRTALAGRELVVAISGHVEAAKTLPLLRDLFGKLPGGDPSPMPTQPGLVPEPSSMVLAGTGNEAWIMVGFPMPGVREDDYPVVAVLNALVGGADSALIPARFREQNGIYDSGSFVQPFAERSHIVGYLRADPLLWDQQKQRLKPVVDDFQRQLLAVFMGLAEHGATEEQVRRAKAYVTGQALRMQEHNRDLAGFLGWYEAIGRGAAFDEQFMQEVRLVTLERVNKLASNRLLPGQAATVVLLPRPRSEDAP